MQIGSEISRPRSRLPMILTGLVIVAAIGGGLYWMLSRQDAVALDSGLTADDVRIVSTKPGQITTLTLPDSSTVKLGPESELRIPSEFGVSMRGVGLTGTATFTAAPKKPRFLVRAGPAILTATGTEFTVRSYADERRTTVMVREGSVEADVGQETRTLTQGLGLVIARDSTFRQPALTELKETVGWPDGTLVFADRELRAVLAEFRKWYGVDLFVSDTALLSRRVTFETKVDSWEEASKALERATNLRRGWQGENMVLRPPR